MTPRHLLWLFHNNTETESCKQLLQPISAQSSYAAISKTTTKSPANVKVSPNSQRQSPIDIDTNTLKSRDVPKLRVYREGQAKANFAYTNNIGNVLPSFSQYTAAYEIILKD